MKFVNFANCAILNSIFVTNSNFAASPPAQRNDGLSPGEGFALHGFGRRDPLVVLVENTCIASFGIPDLTGLGSAKLGKLAIFFANFSRARSRLYQNEILQENMRLTAFFKLYKICILLHRCNLKIFAKNRFEKSAIL